MSKQPIPIIDLFAGPGGLGEGFSSVTRNGKQAFQIKLSIEKDPIAHQTLTLRAFFRQFARGKAPAGYYKYLRGHITRDELFAAWPEHDYSRHLAGWLGRGKEKRGCWGASGKIGSSSYFFAPKLRISEMKPIITSIIAAG